MPYTIAGIDVHKTVNGKVEPVHCELLKLQLEHLTLVEKQIEVLDRLMATALQKHQEAVVSVAEVPGFGPDSAQQIIAEIGADASAFETAGNFASWVGVCPGSNESAEDNKSSRSPKGNFMSAGY